MELVRFPSNGGFSVRRIFAFALAVIIAALLWVVFASTPTHAAPEATWQGEDTLLFDNHGFIKTTDFKDPTNTIPGDAIVYKSTVQPATEGSPDQKLLVLYFAPGVDPPAADSAQYVSFTYKNGEVSNPQGQQTVTVLPPDASGDSGSSCSVEGIGWMVCPVSNFLADAMDNIFNMLATFIAVKPMVLGDTSNSMYIAWNIMRSFANIVFVIAFLVIIYSQVTTLGISNYGLKKLIPRLIVAAVLVNLSYYITAIALDLSNVLGYSIQDVFNAIREQIFHLTNDDLSGAATSMTWATVTGVALGAGGLIGGAYFLASGAIYLLVPLLLGLITTAIVVLIVLAARQAIIVILVIIAPLAFVANLLPNTEKLFEKWKDLFMTMLVFFPAFSLVFGGSQLAGQIIIQNAGDSIIMLIFGMAVQIAPLVITPLILKLSGSLLGRIAQLANNPNKGLLDRSRNWAGKRAELRKNNTLAARKPLKPFKGETGRTKLRNGLSNAAMMANRMTSAPGRPFVRGLDNMGRNLDAQLEVAKTEATNRYEEDNKKYGRIHERKAEADTNKDRIHKQHAAHIDHLRATNGSSLNVGTIELENATVSADLASTKTSSMVSAYRAGAYDTEGNERLTQLQHRMAENVIQTAAWKQADEGHAYVRQRAISDRMQKDDGLLNIAQGHGDASTRLIGRERAQANAEAMLTKLNSDARSNTMDLMESEAITKGMTVKDFAIQQVFNKANSDEPEKRQSISRSRLEAAMELIAKDGQVGIFDQARASEYIDQSLVDVVVARHVPDMKAKGGFHIQASPQLSLQRYIQDFETKATITDDKGNTHLIRPEATIAEVRKSFETDLKHARLNTLSNTNASNLGGVKAGAFLKLASDIKGDPEKNIPSILEVLNTNTGNPKVDGENGAIARRIFESLRVGLTDPTIRATMTDRIEQAKEMEELVRRKYFPDEPSIDPRTFTVPSRPVDPTGSSPSDAGN